MVSHVRERADGYMIWNILALTGNQAAKGENTPKPVVSRETSFSGPIKT